MDELNNDELPVVEEGEKKDPFSEFFDEEYPAGDDLTYEDTVKDEVLEGLAPLPADDLPLSDSETGVISDDGLVTSIGVDVLTFNTAIHNMTVELSSVMLFCAFLIAGTIAAIKLWGSRL